ncbi:NAD(P)/FAD-dependent oxidoreductase [Rhodococcus maanshanensis]|uniref:2-polyprenyl-6-methoxyphenol hydroxylase n=1 Tax=Rhodococcus maanshanensis TaxID=183556 RepID=A0A1H7UKN0_9NOCA|nr:NAD(P)/FAD-dependent oxidoreductase [Rhodococcus maanshanensis]SEL97188.1 2-polyprenyl-6-methoxyphenol hydroxylase [Rhodococcus maanshanensis]
MGDEYDVAIVGSSLAGCTAAILLGRRGLRVALLEANRNPAAYKRMCTHFIQSSALPTLQRLGLDSELEAAGAVRNHGYAWSRFGWVEEPEPTDRPTHGYNLRREILDPLMRRAAAEVPGVDLMLGAKLRELTRGPDGRVDGVVADHVGRLSCRLVVGADGRSSKVARLAGLPGRESRNDRFAYFASFRNVTIPRGQPVQLWLLEPDAAYAFGNDAGVTVLTAVPDKSRLPEFVEDREAALLRMFEDLPDAPDLTDAELVSDVVGVRDYPSITRRRIATPGVALVGDAALVLDPVWGAGCGWALQTAEWLSDAVAKPLVTGTDREIDLAARRYQRRHRVRLWPHQFFAIDFSQRPRFNRLQRLLFAGAARDPWVADRFYAYGTRNRSPFVMFSPRMLARAARARRAGRSE